MFTLKFHLNSAPVLRVRSPKSESFDLHCTNNAFPSLNPFLMWISHGLNGFEQTKAKVETAKKTKSWSLKEIPPIVLCLFWWICCNSRSLELGLYTKNVCGIDGLCLNGKLFFMHGFYKLMVGFQRYILI